ncbi:hypothetical protein AUP68_06542 [Ilyonectria robusta]
MDFDHGVRDFCAKYDVTYQAFWMLRHNLEVLDSNLLASVAKKMKVEKELAFYILILGLGGTQVLNGTTRSETMLEDLRTVDQVFEDETRLRGLQPDVDEFRKLLLKLVS